jgi:N6-L-threonylcarbamoyladenine synthase
MGDKTLHAGDAEGGASNRLRATSYNQEMAIGRGLILGIESSCDETAAAVVRAGEEVLSNVVASQVQLHALYGGVVPELASREHLRNIVPVVRAAMAQANVSFADLDAVAVTEGPGLAGALLVGILYAKSLAFGLGVPLVGVNHLEGHIHAVVMESRRAGTFAAEFPLLALVVSGGHTHLYLAEGKADRWSYRNVGRTVDDAAGEAFDKVAKLLGLGYPGGPWVDALAAFGDAAAVPFHFGQIKSKDAGLRFDFSFSGIKTAVLRYVQMHGLASAAEIRQTALKASPEMRPAAARELCDVQVLNLIASFQSAVVGNLMRQTFAAAEAFGARGLLISGGVAANQELRRRFTAEAARRGLPVAFPSLALSTDNAAMIAAAAWPRLLAGEQAVDEMTAAPQLRLG